MRKGDKVEIQMPASGLVTALEPVMRACSGTWVAHGSGNADKEAVDSHDRVRVPPENPSYQIRRVWLTEEEERATITASPMKASGRYVTWHTLARSFAARIGKNTWK